MSFRTVISFAWMFSALVLVHLVISSGSFDSRNSLNSGEDVATKYNLYRVSNNGGLFSQFLQARMLHNISNKMNKNLILAPFKSKHYMNLDVNMCSVFQFPANVSCGIVPKSVKCSGQLFLNSDKEINMDSCFDGSVQFTKLKSVRQHIVECIDAVDFPFQFQPEMLQHYQEFKTALGIGSADQKSTVTSKTKKGSIKVTTNFTVVHWRRGDQTGRCKKEFDTSINCDNAASLVSKVRLYTNDSIVFVATNEPADSEEVKYLNAHNFHTFGSVEKIIISKQQTNQKMNRNSTEKATTSSKSRRLNDKKSDSSGRHDQHDRHDKHDKHDTHDKQSQELKQKQKEHKKETKRLQKSSQQIKISNNHNNTSTTLYSDLETLAIESMLMIEASTFLAWGLSEVNDVIEYERKKAGKTHCIDQATVQDIEMLTWCALQKPDKLISSNVKFQKSFTEAIDELMN